MRSVHSLCCMPQTQLTVIVATKRIHLRRYGERNRMIIAAAQLYNTVVIRGQIHRPSAALELLPLASHAILFAVPDAPHDNGRPTSTGRRCPFGGLQAQLPIIIFATGVHFACGGGHDGGIDHTRRTPLHDHSVLRHALPTFVGRITVSELSKVVSTKTIQLTALTSNDRVIV